MIRPEDIAKDNDETSHQIALFCWSGQNQKLYPQLKWLHAIPNANSHRMVAEGVRGGVSDVFLPSPKWIKNTAAPYVGKQPLKYCPGLYIELKTEKRRNQKNGGCSDDQIDFIKYTNSVGYKAVVCYSWQEARDIILEYLGNG